MDTLKYYTGVKIWINPKHGPGHINYFSKNKLYSETVNIFY